MPLSQILIPGQTWHPAPAGYGSPVARRPTPGVGFTSPMVKENAFFTSVKENGSP